MGNVKEKFRKYLDKQFSGYTRSKELSDFQEELFVNLNDRFEEYTAEGLSETEAYQKSIDSLGDYSEALKTIDKNTPVRTMLSYSRFLLNASFFYFVVLLIAYTAVSFVTNLWGTTWIILLSGSVAYAIFLFVRGTKNAVVKKKNGLLRFYTLMMYVVLCIFVYLIVSFETREWARSWLCFIWSVTLWFTTDIVLSKLKRRVKMPVRISFAIMMWTLACYLTVSLFVDGIWLYSWIGILCGLAVTTGYLVFYSYQKYRAEIKSGKDQDSLSADEETLKRQSRRDQKRDAPAPDKTEDAVAPDEVK
ncbi:MAG: permease prefix domain 1-containing protein [Clostridiales bacterium]|jgi:hypothetical protein|nr:permease prefix domain 1-containing protein [Clostridiales bacterium]